MFANPPSPGDPNRISISHILLFYFSFFYFCLLGDGGGWGGLYGQLNIFRKCVYVFRNIPANTVSLSPKPSTATLAREKLWVCAFPLEQLSISMLSERLPLQQMHRDRRPPGQGLSAGCTTELKPFLKLTSAPE